MSLGNISADFSTTNMTKTGFYDDVYDLDVDYVPINAVKAIYDVHRYLTKKTMILYKMFRLIKKVLMLVLISAANLLLLKNPSSKCLLLKNQECKVRK